MQKELDGHNSKGTWDLSSVREFADLMKDPVYPEALVGRVFGILGIKNAERQSTMQADLEWKYRSVFQGNNIRTKSGVAAHELFDEVSNAPASFTAARCALAAAALLRKSATVRDALQAYLPLEVD